MPLFANPVAPGGQPPNKPDPKGNVLAGTACDDGFFQGVKQLGDVKNEYADMPVRGYLGFQPAGFPSVYPDGTPAISTGSPRDVWAESYVAKLDAFIISGSLTNSNFEGALRITLILLINTFLWTVGYLSDQLIKISSLPNVPNKGALRNVLADFSQKSLITRWTGQDQTWATQVDVYARNYLCPTLVLDTGASLAAYLANVYEYDVARDFAQANALCPQAFRTLVDTQKYRVGIPETLELWRRDQIITAAVPEFLRRVGVLDDSQVQFVETISFDRPGKGEVIARAQLGLYGNAAVGAWKLDAELDKLPAPGANAPEWRAAIYGKELEDAWKAHWTPVDVATAYQLYRRQVAGLLPQGVNFGDQDLADMIAQSGVFPAFRDHIKSLVWEPLGRRQVKALYDDYIYTESDLLQRLISEGLAPSDAQSLVSDWQKLRPLYTRKLVGGTGPGGLMGEFAKGTIGTSEYVQELTELGFNGQEQSLALAEARAQRTRQTRGQLITWLHARYIKGDATDAQVSAALASFGLDGEDVTHFLQLWRIELEVSPREPSVAEMLQWYCQGLMGSDELTQRLTQMRYSPNDIARIIDMGALKCAQQIEAEAVKWLNGPKSKITKAQAYWSKLISAANKLFGPVNARTKTGAGRILTFVKHTLEGSPPTKASMVGAAAAYAAQQEQANAGQSSQPVPPAGSPGGASTVSGSTGPGGSGSYATPAVPPTAAAAASYPAAAAETPVTITSQSLATEAGAVEATEAANAAAEAPTPAPLSTAPPPGQTPSPTAEAQSSGQAAAEGATSTYPA